MPVAGLLQHLLATLQNSGVAANLVPHRTLYRAQGVHVLRLRADTEFLSSLRHERHVRVASHVTAFHASVRNAQAFHNVTDRRNIGACQLGGALARAHNRAGHNLDQRHTGTVVVHQRERRALDTPVGTAHVGELTGVFLHVGALNLDGEHGAVFQLNI